MGSGWDLFSCWAAPEGEALVLEVAPQLASWDAAGAPSQTRLTEFLDSFERTLRARPIPRGPLALALEVAIDPAWPLLTDRDLDNYLTPVCARLRDLPLASVRGAKRHGTVSRVTLAPARTAAASSDWDGDAFAKPVGSASSSVWKEALHAQVAAQASLAGDGALEWEIAFRTGASREWRNLWKQSIDALGAVLGCDDPARPFHPRDGRIVDLALHHAVDPALGNDVELALRWRRLPQVRDDEVRRKPLSRPPRPAVSRTSVPVAGGPERTVPSTNADGEARVFRHDDEGYLGWVGSHPHGYVLNARQSPGADYLKLHRATCASVRVLRTGYSRWTSGDYLKVCSEDVEALATWARERTGGQLQRGCHCRP